MAPEKETPGANHIDVRVQRIEQLFHTLDPHPFIERVAHQMPANPHNEHYLATKRDRAGHLLR